MQFLEDILHKEKEDRIESLDTQLAPINQEIETAFSDLDNERNGRVQKEEKFLNFCKTKQIKLKML